MNLWIRSQDKKSLRIVSNINIIHEYDKFFICNYTGIANIKLGKDEYEKRALEVLDEIQEFIECREKSNIELNIDGINQTITYPKRTYEMPKE